MDKIGLIMGQSQNCRSLSPFATQWVPKSPLLV